MSTHNHSKVWPRSGLKWPVATNGTSIQPIKHQYVLKRIKRGLDRKFGPTIRKADVDSAFAQLMGKAADTADLINGSDVLGWASTMQFSWAEGIDEQELLMLILAVTAARVAYKADATASINLPVGEAAKNTDRFLEKIKEKVNSSFEVLVFRAKDAPIVAELASLEAFFLDTAVPLSETDAFVCSGLIGMMQRVVIAEEGEEERAKAYVRGLEAAAAAAAAAAATATETATAEQEASGVWGGAWAVDSDGDVEMEIDDDEEMEGIEEA